MPNPNNANYRLGSMKDELSAVFAILPAAESDAAKKISYALLRVARMEHTKPGGLPILWILDEMAASLPAATAKLVQGSAELLRKFKIRLAGVCQSWAQFVVWCGGVVQARAIRAVMGATVHYGASDPTSIAEIQEESGSYTIWSPTTDIEAEYGLKGGVSPVGVPLFQPEDIRAMIREQKQIVFLLGARRVCVLPRTDYRDIPELARRAAPDLYHQ